MRKPKSHVTVLLGIMCGVRGREQRIECRRRFDRIEPVSLVDGGALGNKPTTSAVLDTVEETGKRGQIGLHGAELLAHADDDGRLGYGAKSLVDPAHAAVVNGVLTPDDDELRRARDIVATFEAARAAGRSRAELEGSLIEVPTYTNAKRLIARGEAMRQYERGDASN